MRPPDALAQEDALEGSRWGLAGSRGSLAGSHGDLAGSQGLYSDERKSYEESRSLSWMTKVSCPRLLCKDCPAHTIHQAKHSPHRRLLPASPYDVSPQGPDKGEHRAPKAVQGRCHPARTTMEADWWAHVGSKCRHPGDGSPKAATGASAEKPQGPVQCLPRTKVAATQTQRSIVHAQTGWSFQQLRRPRIHTRRDRQPVNYPSKGNEYKDFPSHQRGNSLPANLP